MNNLRALLLDPTKSFGDRNFHPTFNSIKPIRSYPFPPLHLAAAALRGLARPIRCCVNRRRLGPSGSNVDPHQTWPPAAFHIFDNLILGCELYLLFKGIYLRYFICYFIIVSCLPRSFCYSIIYPFRD